MAKRRAREEATSKPRLEIRFDSEVYEKMQKLAESAGISVNQLVNGVMRWAMANGYAGEQSRDEEGLLRVKEQAGCLMFGKFPTFFIEEERDWLIANRGEDPGLVKDKGQVFFELDFTERRVVKE